MPDQLHSAPVNIQMNVPLDDLVGPCVDRPDSERVCTRLYEVIVGQFFREYHHGFQQCSRSGADDDSEDAEQLRTMLLSLLWPAMTTMIYKSESQYKIEAGRSRERRWPSNDLFFQVCVGIRSEASLRSVAMKLLSEDIDDAESDKAIGVLFSGEHVAIVCFDGLQDASPESRTASCSPLLRFLPDRFGTSPSTPGINALVRLGQSPCAWLDYSILYRLLTDVDPSTQVPGPLRSFPPPPGGGPLMNLPHELLSQIVDHLDDNDLLNFAAVSEQTNIAVRACRRIRYPVIDRRHRLVKVRPLRFQPQVLPNGAVLRAEEFHELVAAAFVTEDDKVLLLGFNPADYALYLMISWTKCWGSGTLTMPYVLGRQIRIPYVVLDKDVVVDLENDATTDDLLGRISRRGTRIMDQYYQYRRGAEHPAEVRCIAIAVYCRCSCGSQDDDL
ncbi:hypothetical protein EVJ58_g877 [Rhodofomes roseus]|uniref:F-box domain-containing protein n=1 Tax=Rhodofomes roseus TaxID=34475 RepID=A0A4Y9Z493_9APHY|nr:hypothetical protein EVJ58_g877 [Rhodofomes roseus]